MKKHLFTYLSFCAAYLLSSVVLAGGSYLLQNVIGRGFTMSGLFAAVCAAYVAGVVYGRMAGRTPSNLTSTAHTLIMGGFVLLITLVQLRSAAVVQSPEALSPMTTGFVIPALLVMHFIVLRICFPLGAKPKVVATKPTHRMVY
jgi:hypothetical protein